VGGWLWGVGGGRRPPPPPPPKPQPPNPQSPIPILKKIFDNFHFNKQKFKNKNKIIIKKNEK